MKRIFAIISLIVLSLVLVGCAEGVTVETTLPTPYYRYYYVPAPYYNYVIPRTYHFYSHPRYVPDRRPVAPPPARRVTPTPPMRGRR